MFPEFISLDPSSLEVDEQAILELLFPTRQIPDDHTLALLEECKRKCLERWDPVAAVVYAEVLITEDPKTISTPSIRFNCGGTIAKMLRGSEQFAFFIATIGPGPENLARELLQAGHYPEAYITDLVATALTEATVAYCHRHIQDHAGGLGLKTSNRYSPGYCGWKVEEQQKLFSLFPKDCCGIRLTESCLMHPIKSVSALAGLGKEVSYRDYTCELCSMTGCMYRKTRPGQHGGKKNTNSQQLS